MEPQLEEGVTYVQPLSVVVVIYACINEHPLENRVGGWGREMKFTKAGFQALVLLGVAGCSNSTGQEFSLENAKQIHVGLPKTDVLRLMGQPVDRNATYGTEMWTYRYFKTSTTAGAAMFVPFVGGYLPGAMNSTSTSKMVMVSFKDGVVDRCTMVTSDSAGASGGGLVNVNLQPGTSTNTSDCAGP